MKKQPRKLTPAIKEQMRAEVAERKAARAAYTAAMQGSVERAKEQIAHPEPVAYTKSVLTSAVVTKARGAKAAATRRRNAARRAAAG